MVRKESFILIGNYPKDKQESMERFTLMLKDGFIDQEYQTDIWRPIVLFGTCFNSTTTGLGKWLGYFDKWVIFPLVLKFRIFMKGSKNVHYHVCDHSNAPYLKFLPTKKTAITCHDVLAIRGALGYQDAYCPASTFGKILQKWILKNLKKANLLAAVSALTLHQLEQLIPVEETNKNWRVIYNAFNADFSPLNATNSAQLLSDVGINTSIPFILHVGSSLPRKNRQLLLHMIAALGDRWQGVICFAGKPVDGKLKAQAELLGLQDRIVSVVKPGHATLLALYSACDAFVFPSFSEGFGWPVIEAQACGAPVIASNLQPMPEVSGGAALHADPTKAEEFAEALLTLQDPSVRELIIKAGFKNCLRFKKEPIIQDYLRLHGVKKIQSEYIS